MHYCDLTAAKGASGAQWLVALLVGTAVVEDVQVLVDVGVLELCPAVVGDQRATLVHGEERLRPDGVAGRHGRDRGQEDEDSLQHDE